LLVAAATGILLFCMEIEEKMLVTVSGEGYQEYQRTTKKIIPHIY